ncbi:dienelactone hydrolase family protein [Corynebacterium caspium]|uniref:dienelactone hydrolase family protein n=1 Tax=Corynebacterium caspium TaxID=234828 RepID=UPI0003A4F5E5|nr:dienelactone hydrolase family protein [Corynebacterium caspium]
MAEKLSKTLSKLSKRGPHRVLIGELDYAGLSGVLYTPDSGSAIPAVAFGHDWMTDVKHYHHTLKHLASWGIAVAAPNTELGFLADHRSFARDLESSLQILAGVKLGQGNVVVSPGKLGVIGHGMGAGCAVLAGADNPKVKALAALYPAITSPSADIAAATIKVPGLILGSGEDSLLEAGNPASLAKAWGGKAVYREIKKGTQQGFPENTLFKLLLGVAKPQTAARETARGLLTGFLLYHLDGNKKYASFADSELALKGISSLTPVELAEKAKGIFDASTLKALTA